MGLNKMYNILNKQNEEWYLDRLIAQRFIYGKSKNIRVCGNFFVFLAIFVELFLFLPVEVVNNIPSEWFNMGSVIFLILAFIMDAWADRTQEKAAKIQQDFDCNLFCIEGYSTYFIDDDINDIVIKAEKKDYTIREQVRNWYSDSISKLQFPYSVLACQQQNLCWTMSLSRRYLNILIGINLIVIASTVSIYYTWNFFRPIDSIHDWWSFINVCIALLKIPVSRFINVRKSISDKRNFLEREKSTFSDINSNRIELINEIIKRIQNEIFEFRKNHKPIPDIVYKFSRWQEETKSRKRLSSQ